MGLGYPLGPAECVAFKLRVDALGLVAQAERLLCLVESGQRVGLVGIKAGQPGIKLFEFESPGVPVLVARLETLKQLGELGLGRSCGTLDVHGLRQGAPRGWRRLERIGRQIALKGLAQMLDPRRSRRPAARLRCRGCREGALCS